MHKRLHLRGYTIVEILVVLVVLSVLVSISIVVYSGIQQRGRDSERKTNLASIKHMLQSYKQKKGDFIGTGSGCGSNGNGNGWFNFSNGSSYPKSMMQCLLDENIATENIADPTGKLTCSGLTCTAYMKYNCGTATYIFANLEGGTHNGTETDSTCATSLDSTYGMNYFVKVE